MKSLNRQSVILTAIAGLMTFLLGLAVVWMNIERVELAYGLKRLQTSYDDAEALSSKLRLERDNLVSPYRLRKLAEQYGLHPAKPGQIRKMTTGKKDAS